MKPKHIKKLGRKPIGKQGRTAPFSMYECIDCKDEFEALEWNVNSGKTSRCKKCHRTNINKVNSKRLTTHGETKTRLFSIWNNIRDRCHNKGQSQQIKYKNYRDSGITLCEEWINDFVAFRDWSKENGYDSSLELDKDILCDKFNISPKIYSPKTCQWITVTENRTYKTKNLGL